MKRYEKYVNAKTFWLTFLGLMLLKYGYYGFRYYPVIDDWIQYGGYRLYDNIFRDVVIEMKLYAARPLANLSDPYIWGRFWGVMGIVFFIITMMHALSAYFLYKVFEDNRMPLGISFLIVFGLLPLGTEATYWISASARVVVGTFFMALSLFLLNLYIKREKNIYLWTFFITNLASMGYYEQVIALSFFGVLLLLAVNWRAIKHKWIVSLPCINFFAIAMYYKAFSKIGNVAVRGEFVKSNFIKHTMLVLDEVTDVFGQVHIPFYTNGFPRGMDVLLSNDSYIFLLLLLLFSFAAAVFAYKDKNIGSIKINIFKIVVGFVLFWVPFGPNFLLELVWICIRNAFTSFIGLALIIDGVLGIFFRGKIGTLLKGLGVFIATFVFLVVNVSEITDYKNVSEADQKMSANIIAAVKDPGFLEGKKSVIIFNTKSSYIEQNYYFRDHIHNVSSSDWALTGGVRGIARNEKILYLRPVSDGEKAKINKEVWDTYIIMGMKDDLSVFPLNIQKQANGDVQLFAKDGRLFGTAYMEDKDKYIFKKE